MVIRELVEMVASIPREEIVDGASLKEDLGLDSLTLMEIALSVDQRYDLDFSEDELMAMTSVEVAADMVSERLKSKAAS